MAGDVEKVLKVLVAGTEQGPDRAGPLVDVSRFSFPGVITQECSIQTRVRVLHELHLQHPHICIASGWDFHLFVSQQPYLKTHHLKRSFAEHRSLYYLIINITGWRKRKKVQK